VEAHSGLGGRLEPRVLFSKDPVHHLVFQWGRNILRPYTERLTVADQTLLQGLQALQLRPASLTLFHVFLDGLLLGILEQTLKIRHQQFSAFCTVHCCTSLTVWPCKESRSKA
jgi:hypothetical protein